MSSDVLEMKFDPNTIQHLGVQMYYTLPPVIAEIVANSYDADAENVDIYLNDTNAKEIIIDDDGHGMSFEELNSKFLLIGRNRRESIDLSEKKERPVIGKKGLGKLSFFGIANEIIVETVKDSVKNVFLMNIEDIKKEKSGIYRPRIIEQNQLTENKNGTKVFLKNMRRKSAFDVDGLSVSLARTFSIFNEKDFNVKIIHNNNFETDLRNEIKYTGIDSLVDFDLPLLDVGTEYSEKDNLSGKVIVAKDTTIPNPMRGLALFSRGKLVNEYSYYDVKATSHGYSYISGEIDVSFIDGWDRDVISTNRRSLNWEDEGTIDLKQYLNELLRHIYNEQRKLRKIEKKNEVKKKTGVDVDFWIEELPKHEKGLAKRIVDDVLNSEGIDVDKAADLIEYIKDSFQYESFKEFAAELEDIDEITSENMIGLLREWQIIEAREFYKLSLVRIETIKKFEAYIQKNAREVPTLHNFFKSFGWLLDPRIIEFEDEVTYSDLLRNKFKQDQSDIEENKRIDFLCTTIANTLFVIELKRPNQVVNEKVINQANEYAAFIEKHLGTDGYAPKQIITYIVCGRKNSKDAVQRMVKSYEKSGDLYVRTYSELLAIAKKYHKEFLEKYDSFKKEKTDLINVSN